METHDREQRELECYLRRFRPQMPPESLHERILTAASRPSPATRRWVALLYLAAVALISASLPLNNWIDREDPTPRPGEPDITLQLLQEELTRS